MNTRPRNDTRKSNANNVSVVTLKDDQAVLHDGLRLQGHTRAAIARMKQQTQETHDIGLATLTELHNQRETMMHISNQTDRLHSGLAKTEQLQNKLSRWTLTFQRQRATKLVRREKQEERRHEERRAKFQSNKPITAKQELQRRLAQAQERHDNKQARENLQNLLIDIVDKDKATPSTAPSWEPQSKNSAQQTRSVGHPVPSNKVSTSNKQQHCQNQDPLAELQAQDEEIEEALDGLGHQIEALLDLAKAQRQEVTSQQPLLTLVQDEMETAVDKQKVANYRALGFLTRNNRRLQTSR